MTRFGTIDFDDAILDALRDGKLVVFAGAGVSMGPPSNLPDFRELAGNIEQGKKPGEKEPLDRFLGQLQHRQIAVHELAAQLITPAGSAPNALHSDLLRLFRTVNQIRVVTTNFDRHFETAAQSVFNAVPQVYCAPALPRGRNFCGIVHVHGAVTRVHDIVLTDADFGRAYLTEGWARRFLVDVFQHYTVMFVGYSHDDTVMHYLSRALPVESSAGRFALTDKPDKWDILGITPLRFNKVSGANAYQELYDGVHRLAERVSRGALDWQSRIAELAGHAPSMDQEAIDEVKQALREVYTARFFVKVARDPEWVRWLHTNKYLDPLFSGTPLGERDILLGRWLADHFIFEYIDVVFEILSKHDLRLNPDLWFIIGRALGVTRNKPLGESALKRWISILLVTIPPNADHHVLLWLTERCAVQDCVELTMQIFLIMGEHQLHIKPGVDWSDSGQKQDLAADCPLRANYWFLHEIWSKLLKPHLDLVAQPMLSGITKQLESIHCDLLTWDKASREWDPVSYGRAAIELHEQDRYPEAVDALIDAARDALEWFASNNHALYEAWITILIASKVPLLRRLAIHAITIHPHMSADERLRWLLERVGLHDYLEHHEVFRAVALNYPFAADTTRQAIVKAVLDYSLPANEHNSAEVRTARWHLKWLSWLLQAKPDCSLAAGALTPLMEQYPDWEPSDHPDLTHWVGSMEWAGSESPWPVETLLDRPLHEQINDLLTFNDSSPDGLNRDGLLDAVREACKKDPRWAFSLMKVIIERALWSSDLWPAVFRALQESELTLDDWRGLLDITTKPELQAAYPRDIARLLSVLVRDGGKPFALQVLDQANAIALSLWDIASSDDEYEAVDDWLSHAINHPAGIVVEFWLHGLSLLMSGKTGEARILPDNYRQWFTTAVQDQTVKGGMGRSLLASQIAFLSGFDEEWVSVHLIPLFSDSDQQRFQQAWEGFLGWGRLTTSLVDRLLPAFIGALPRLDADLQKHRRRFMEYYTAFAVYHVSDPMQQLLPELFQHGGAEDHIAFAEQLGEFLRQMETPARQNLWDSWLRYYWEARLKGVLAPLREEEIQKMLNWLLVLEEDFPAGVSLTIRFPKIRIEHSHLLFELHDSELVIQFPIETAQLLIYLCRCDVGFHAPDLRMVANRLTDLPPELRHELEEGLALVGA